MRKRCPKGLDLRETATWLIAHKTELSEAGCLVWTGHKMASGYGQVRYNGVLYTSHRFIKIALEGEPTDPKMHAAHSCFNKPCVNTAHVSWQTARENILGADSMSACAKHARKGQCPKCGGVYTRRGAGRRCHSCDREYSRNYERDNKHVDG